MLQCLLCCIVHKELYSTLLDPTKLVGATRTFADESEHREIHSMYCGVVSCRAASVVLPRLPALLAKYKGRTLAFLLLLCTLRGVVSAVQGCGGGPPRCGGWATFADRWLWCVLSWHVALCRTFQRLPADFA